jgi:hypothetical protein
MAAGGHRHTPAALPRERDPASTVQEAGWAPGLVWMDAENLASTVIRSPDRPARSESLYRLTYPGPQRSNTKAKFFLSTPRMYKSGTAPLIPNLDKRWWEVSLKSWPLYHREKNPGTHRIRDRVGPRVSLDVLAKRKLTKLHRNSNPASSSLRQPV